jgi:hypothetical protein
MKRVVIVLHAIKRNFLSSNIDTSQIVKNAILLVFTGLYRSPAVQICGVGGRTL